MLYPLLPSSRLLPPTILPHPLTHSLTDSLAWQARHVVRCKRSDVRPGPGIPWSPPLCRWLLRGRCGAGLCGRSDVITPWRPLVSAALPVAFAWQVRHLLLCKGSPWRPLVSAALPVAFAWQVRHLVLIRLLKQLKHGKRRRSYHSNIGRIGFSPKVLGNSWKIIVPALFEVNLIFFRASQLGYLMANQCVMTKVLQDPLLAQQVRDQAQAESHLVHPSLYSTHTG